MDDHVGTVGKSQNNIQSYSSTGCEWLMLKTWSHVYRFDFQRMCEESLLARFTVVWQDISQRTLVVSEVFHPPLLTLLSLSSPQQHFFLWTSTWTLYTKTLEKTKVKLSCSMRTKIMLQLLHPSNFLDSFNLHHLIKESSYSQNVCVFVFMLVEVLNLEKKRD